MLNGPSAKNGVLQVIQVTTFFLSDVLTTQMSIFILFVSRVVLFESAFFLWVSLIFLLLLDTRGSGSVLWILQRKILELTNQFLLIFCMNLESHEVRKVTKSDFWKRSFVDLGGFKKSQKWPKNEVLGVSTKTLLILIYLFTWIWKY